MSKFKTKYTKEILEEAIKGSTSVTQVVVRLGLAPRGGSVSHISKRIKELNLSWPHYKGGKGVVPVHKKTPEKVLKYNPILGRERGSVLRRALIESGVQYICIKCGVGDTWQSEPLILQVDHIDGDIQNNCKDNLRFLCPNCHTQTVTYGKNNIRPKAHTTHPIDLAKSGIIVDFECPTCQKVLAVTKQRADRMTHCSRECYKKIPRMRSFGIAPTKADWPDRDTLEKMVWSNPVIHVGSNLGVSGNAVKKRCKNLGISVPPRGYWAKKKAGKL